MNLVVRVFFSKILTSHSSVIFLHSWQTGTIKHRHSKWQFVLHICVGFANYTFLLCENCTSLWLAKVTCLVLIRFPLQIKILNSLPVEWLQMEVIAVNKKCDIKQKETLLCHKVQNYLVRNLLHTYLRPDSFWYKTLQQISCTLVCNNDF